jgi:hypothetical protein
MKSWILLLCWCLTVSARGQLWTPVAHKNSAANSAERGRYYLLDSAATEAICRSAIDGANDATITAPDPTGKLHTFWIKENGLIPRSLAAKYGLAAFDLRSADGTASVGKAVWSSYGVQITILGKDGWAVERTEDKLTYVSKPALRDGSLSDMLCLTEPSNPPALARKDTARALVRNGDSLRRYRFALSCNYFYSRAVTKSLTPTKAEVLSKMAVSLNRVNGVYERELAITMQFVPNMDRIVFVDSATDPLGPANTSPGFIVGLNQEICDSFIGNANYDVGHVFTTGGGGLSQVGCVCLSATKAQSVTGSATPFGDIFDIDYVVHEIGHEFGANHTFNNNRNGSCGGPANQATAIEPGSGSTIMAYAGICGPDNIQRHSDDYFSVISLKEVINYITTTGSLCGEKVATGNIPPTVSALQQTYDVPYLTPIMLTAPTATSSVASTQPTYCWEQWNFGDFGTAFYRPSNNGPSFRSYPADTSPTRTLPRMQLVMMGKTDDTGRNNAQGEKLPYDGRFLTFRLTVRNLATNGNGAFVIPEDTVHLDVRNTGRPFTVLSQDQKGLVYLGGSTDVVSWDNAGTNGAPFNVSEVDMYVTPDSGKTFPYYLGRFPNSGSANVVFPAIDSPIAKARLMVKATGNVFFNVNKQDFTIISNNDSTTVIRVFPSPAHSVINLVPGKATALQVAVYSADGREIWKKAVTGIEGIDVSYWARGVYIFKAQSAAGETAVRKVVIY